MFGKLNLGLPWQKQRSTGRSLFSPQIGLAFKEEISEVVDLYIFFLWC
jgi:hypothetical protein